MGGGPYTRAHQKPSSPLPKLCAEPIPGPVETTAQWQGDSAALTPEKSSISQSVLMCVVLEVLAETCRGDKGVFPLSH